MEKRHLVGIDIIRFIAAVAVAYFHLGHSAFFRPDDLIFGRLQLSAAVGHVPLAAFGWVGVQVFLVISGFVIAYSVEGESVGTYARRRVLRLVPAVWIIAPFCAVISIRFLDQPAAKSITDLGRTLVFLPTNPWIMGQFWTLAVEMVFYSCVGILISVRRVDLLEPFGFVLAILGGVYWCYDALMPFGNHGQQLTRLCLVQHGIYFAMGITIRRIGVTGLTPIRLVYMAGLCVPAFLQIRWTAQWEAIGIDPITRSVAPFLFWLFATCSIMVCALPGTRRQNPRYLRIVKVLGLATYPLYLLHYHAGGALMIVLVARGCSPVAAMTAALLLSIGTAILVALYAEPWVRRRLSQLLVSIGFSSQRTLTRMSRQSGSA